MLFDTDVIIWCLRGNPKAATVIDQTDSLQLSAISYMELLKGARDKKDLHLIKDFIHDIRFSLLPISQNISHRAIIYMEEYALGSGLDLADALIGATSTEHNLHLCTGNYKHYKVIPHLKITVFKP
ncbi:MAG: type II toxin-antitoxin system VapC family toxin [Deltaproteobacteria bacterium]|nr:type II toxin-antitoxin system VapC family toxin [Deltaproteobacteria bacterium]